VPLPNKRIKVPHGALSPRMTAAACITAATIL
jgi:hypothetical protein